VPNLETELIAIAERAYRLREETDQLAGKFVRTEGKGRGVVDATLFRALDRDARAHLWPAVLAPLGVVLDRRGVDRLAQWSEPSGSIPLSGGFRVVANGAELRVMRDIEVPGSLTLPTDGEVQFGPWRFTSRMEREGRAPQRGELWSALVGGSAPALVRAWQPGDRLHRGAEPPRRVKRYLSEAGIPDAERRGWPVLVTKGEIVWIPGASRAHVAPDRPGRPMRLITCERIGY
jgi:tRNA(Ile)-lysidine synthetase-like protein